ncbi:hypothetical protein [Rhizobium sp. MHM7A]|uniref:hypothetical protein n=1 Tax=Rhizobium sp. MHM7A TaxID=2583233 RepID=UPI00110661BB|nr:hypothetical protein [Rhizobium sp. MHM7A]TLX16691.1 hypothetical protein FFR93_04940 [Rhizobium sp. MHM7A]
MNTLNLKISSGKLCALIAATFFLTVIILAFPGMIPAILATAIKYAAPMLTIGGAGVAFICGLMTLEKLFPGMIGKFLEKISDNFALVFNCGMIFVMVGGGFVAFLALEYRILVASLAVIQGVPIDSIGTIIPITPTTVVALHIAMLMGAVCFGRHCIYANFDTETQWLKVTMSTVVALVMMILVSGFVGMAIREAYVDRSAEKRTELVERIKKEQENLDKLKQELLLVETAGK